MDAGTEAIVKMAGDVGYIRGRVDELVEGQKSHELRISALETERAARAGENTVKSKNERFINVVITTIISAAIALSAAYIDRQQGDTNAATITTLTRDTIISPSRPAGGR
jgi:hypothetical protein